MLTAQASFRALVEELPSRTYSQSTLSILCRVCFMIARSRAAVRERCAVLVMFNERNFRPGHPDVGVVTPGVLVQRVRELVSQAGAGSGA